MALTKITDADDVILGFTCVTYAPPPTTPVAPPVATPPPPINVGGPNTAPPLDNGCDVVNAFEYQDSVGNCWRLISYPCAAGNTGSVYRTPITCP